MAPDGGRATYRGLYLAELTTSSAPGVGSGATVEAAVANLASDLVASIEVDGYPTEVVLQEDELIEAELLRAAMRGTLAPELLAAAGEPTLTADYR